MEDVSLRPVREEDEEFLARLYASTRQEELAPVPWSEEQKQAFLRAQFDAQTLHYRRYYPGAQWSLIERAGRPAGRLYLHRGPSEIRVMDIALLPEHRGAGIGASLLRAILEEAAASNRRVTVHVEQANPAQRLYRRLGFVKVSETGIYDLMEWRPSSLGEAATRDARPEA